MSDKEEVSFRQTFAAGAVRSLGASIAVTASGAPEKGEADNISRLSF